MPSVPARPLFLLDPLVRSLDTSRNGRSVSLLLASPIDVSDNESDSSTQPSSPRSCRQSPLCKKTPPLSRAKDQQVEETTSSAESTTDELQQSPHPPLRKSQELLFPGAESFENEPWCGDGESEDDEYEPSMSMSSSTTASPSHENSQGPSSATTSAQPHEEPAKDRSCEETRSETTEETVSNSSFSDSDILNSHTNLETPSPPPISSSESRDKSDPEDEPSTSSNDSKKTNKPKRSVGFKALSTLYLFEAEETYNPRDTWYSSNDLKSFRADAFLTVNWMVMKECDPEGEAATPAQQQPPPEEDEPSTPGCSLSGSIVGSIAKQHRSNVNHSYNYCYYSNKYGYDRQKELLQIAQYNQQHNQLRTMGDYEFCTRGIECRTPMGRLVKNKRRLDATKVVMLYQEMQKQHRRERKRALRRKQQAQHHRRDASVDDLVATQQHPPQGALRHRRPSKPDPDAVRKIEADIDAESLANVYGSYCEESGFEASERGRADACEVGTSPLPTIADGDDIDDDEATTSSSTTAPVNPRHVRRSSNTGEALVHCHSLCDEDDDEDDDLVRVSFVDHHGAEDDDESMSSSNGSVTSISLADLLFGSLEDEEEKEQPRRRSSSIEEVESSEVEIEFVEDDADQPHRIYVSNDSTRSRSIGIQTDGDNAVHGSPRPPQRRRHPRNNSWSHPAMRSPGVPKPSSAESKSVLSSPPAHSSHSSFSSLELGRLFGWF